MSLSRPITDRSIVEEYMTRLKRQRLTRFAYTKLWFCLSQYTQLGLKDSPQLRYLEGFGLYATPQIPNSTIHGSLHTTVTLDTLQLASHVSDLPVIVDPSTHFSSQRRAHEPTLSLPSKTARTLRNLKQCIAAIFSPNCYTIFRIQLKAVH